MTRVCVCAVKTSLQLYMSLLEVSNSAKLSLYTANHLKSREISKCIANNRDQKKITKKKSEMTIIEQSVEAVTETC